MIRPMAVFDLDNPLTESKSPITQAREIIDACIHACLEDGEPVQLTGRPTRRGRQHDARGHRFKTRRARHRITYWRSTSALKLFSASSRLLPFMRLTMSASASLPITPAGSA
jgi:hypothetical protein